MTTIREAFERGEGVFHLVPNWVPHNFNRAGGRLRLHPDDYFAFGMQRGSIKERWFCSTVSIGNGATIPADAGLSYVAPTDDAADQFLFSDAVAELGADLIGAELMAQYGGWPMYAKFFDYFDPLFHHLHLDDVAAGRIGRLGKPEAYYFPRQLNDHLGAFPLTYFGFDPDVTPEMVRERLADWNRRDTRITELSRAYRIELGTGWYTPPGIVHAPGSVLTYEPQWNSNVGSVWENVTSGEIFPYGSLVGGVPDDHKQDMDYIMSLLDWDTNVDPHYRKHYFRPPVPARAGEGYTENWISYANPYVGAKELTILPGHTITVKDAVAHGCIIIQGHGSFGVYDAEAPIMLRVGQLSADEYFVSEAAARAGIVIRNDSRWEPMVILKHFGPNHPDMPQAVA